MTKRKVIKIIFVLILMIALLAGCSANQQKYAMIRMPDGSIVQGSCSYSEFSYGGNVTVVIDGIRYRTGAENVMVWKDEGR